MPSFDEAKSPLTLANIQAWAYSKFPDAFDALPLLEKLAFNDVDYTTFDRTVRRSLGRSMHKKLLIVGAYSPGTDIEDVEVCAHIHAGEDEVTFYRIHELEDETLELRPVTSPGHIAFHPPFSPRLAMTSAVFSQSCASTCWRPATSRSCSDTRRRPRVSPRCSKRLVVGS
jgi:hypothetical protein